MLYAVFSDIHGTDLGRLESEVLQTLKPDVVVCLGDIDTAESLRQVMELQRKYPMHVVPGNHDLALSRGYPAISFDAVKRSKAETDAIFDARREILLRDSAATEIGRASCR